jgi:hypothetical protein
MNLARRIRFAVLPGAVLVACSAAQTPSPPDASADAAPVADAAGVADAGVDALGAPLTTGTVTFHVNGASYAISGAFLTGYGPSSAFDESADNVSANVQLQWSGAGVGTYPCTYALVYVFAATSLSCDYEYGAAPNPATGGACTVTITSDGPNEGDPVVGTFTGSLPPNPNAQNIKTCSNPGILSGSFTQPRPTSADAGTP